MLKQLLIGSVAIALAFASSLPVPAQAQAPTQPPATLSQTQEAPQIEVSQEELQKFASAIQKIQTIDQEAQADLVETIESHGLTPERFSEIALVQQNPEMEPTTEISPQEAQQFDQAIGQLAQIHQQVQAKMQKAVEGEGLNVEQFNQIFAAVQQDPALQQQVQEMLQN